MFLFLVIDLISVSLHTERTLDCFPRLPLTVFLNALTQTNVTLGRPIISKNYEVVEVLFAVVI